MMKFIRVLLLVMLFIFTVQKTYATDVTEYQPHKIIVQFQENFSTNNPSENVSVVVNKDYKIDNKILEKGTIIYLEVTKINSEKIGKQDVTINARIVRVYLPKEDKTIDVAKINPNANVKFSHYEELDVADKASDVGIKVANRYVKNIAYPAYFVKGAIKNEEGNPLKSGWNETYDSSVFSYVNSGKPLDVKNGDLVTLTFYTKDVSITDITK